MADDVRGVEIRDERREVPRDSDRESTVAPGMDVRDDDLEPHAGLRYVARMFKILAILLIFLMVAEIIIGLVQEGQPAIPQLLVNATRLIVWAGLLWGAADMGLMLIESNHDLRATRILVGRLNVRVQRLEQVATGLQRGTPLPPPPAPPAVEPRERPR